MAHYALIDPNTNVVIQVFVGKDETDSGIDWEQYYAPAGFICRRTSYNTHGNVHTESGVPFRKNYAGVGYTFDAARDAFIPPQPFPSWTLNDDTCLWEPPVPYPDDGQDHTWNENTQSWSPVT